jgi:hypothetical protein
LLVVLVIIFVFFLWHFGDLFFFRWFLLLLESISENIA